VNATVLLQLLIIHNWSASKWKEGKPLLEDKKQEKG